MLLSRLRAHPDEVTALALLRAGRVRRSRAALRLHARSARGARLDVARFHQAVALFWEGAFEKARAYAAEAASSDDGRLEVLSVALQVECLLFEDRVADARALFDTYAAALTSHPGYEHVVSSGSSIAAMLRFREGDIECSRTELEAIARDTDSHTPVARVISFYLGAIAHTQGHIDDARRYLVETIERGGELFVSRSAADTHGELFPDEPIPSPAFVRERRPRARWRSSTLRNLKRGLGLLFFRRSGLTGASYTFEQTIALLVINLACAGLLRSVDFARGASFMEHTAFALAGTLATFLGIAWIATRGAGPSNAAVNVAGAFYSALPTLLVLDFVAVRTLRPGPAHVCGVVLGVWAIAVVLLLLVRVARGGPVRSLVASVLFIACCIGPMSRVRAHPLWLKVQQHASFDEDERELLSFVFGQADRVHAAEAALVPERPGIPDLYFVGFAGWGEQDVFLNEVTAARALFDERFDTRGRSLLLANDPSSRRTLPMATKLNLGHVLKAVGERMNPDEDVLFLFLTSHGSRAGLGLASSNHPVMSSEEGVSPTELRSMLEETRIKWRVIVVSGCESGVFIAPLANEHTLVATASASDRNSFGCGSGRQFTEYGRALFAEQLRRERSFETAIERANTVVAEREKASSLTASLPQISVGAAIREKLRTLEARVGDDDGGVGP